MEKKPITYCLLMVMAAMAGIHSGCNKNNIDIPAINNHAPKIVGKDYVRLEKKYDIDVTEISLFNKTDNFKNFVDFDRNGNMFIADSFESKVFVYDNHGIFKYSFGAHGEGPNDLSTVNRILIDDAILRVFEGHNIIKNVTLDGKYLSRDIIYINNRLGVKRTGRDYYFMYGKTDDEFRRLDLIIARTDKHMSNSKDIIKYDNPEGMRESYEFKYYDWLLITADNELYFPEDNLNKYSIVKYDKEGKALKTIERKYDIHGYSDEAKSRFNAIYKKEIDDKRLTLPKNPPIINMMFEDANKNIWVLVGETYEDNRIDGYENLVDIFNNSGEWLHSFKTKHLSRNCIYNNGKIYRFVPADEKTSKQCIEVYEVKYGS